MLGLILMAMLWQNDVGLTYNQVRAGAPAYLSGADAVRWQRVRACRMLFRGQHRQYFLHEGHTQNNFPIELIENVPRKRYVTFNLCKLISNTTADLMFGVPPRITAPTPQQQSRLDDLTRSSLLNARFHEAAVQQSWAGGAFLEPTIWNGQAWIEVAPAEEMFPQGRLRPDGQFSSYARYTEDVIPGADGKEPLRVVLKTTYTRGLITRELRTLDDEGKFKGELPLEKWPAFAGEEAVPAPEQPTGIGECSIVYVPNKLDDSIGISDFDGLIELQDNVNAKYAQFAKVIAQHGDPKLWFGTEGGGAGDTAQVRATDNAFWGPEKPEYIVWQAQLDAAQKDRIDAIMAFCAAAEMSPVLLGIRQGATPDAARKLRLEATKDLSKTNRKGMVMQPAISLALEIAQRLDQSNALLRSYPIAPPAVQMRDGLPVDGIDRAQEASLWAGTGAISDQDLVAMRVEDPDEAKEELARVEAKKAAATPSVLLQRPDMSGAGDAGDARCS
jgi:hypothetical protein